MADISHKTLGYAEAHVFHFAEYANAAARTGAGGLSSADNNKIALQTDNNTFWMLTDYSGPTWVQVMGSFYSQAEVQAIATKAAPIGTVDMTLLTTAPTGWLLLNGETMGDASSGGDNASADYEDLFAIIKEVAPNAGSEVWGDHDTVDLPDMANSFPLGAAASLGTTGGASSVDLEHSHSTPDHTLITAEMPAHNHSFSKTLKYQNALAGGPSEVMRTSLGTTITMSNTGGGTAHNHGTSGDAGSATQDILNPYVKINFMVKFAAY